MTGGLAPCPFCGGTDAVDATVVGARSARNGRCPAA